MFHTPNVLRRVVFTSLAVMLLATGIAAAQQGGPATPAGTAVVDINSAPLEEIQGVVVDEGLAQRIIENRPYANKRQLVSRRLVTAEQYDEFKDRIVARRVASPPEQ